MEQFKLSSDSTSDDLIPFAFAVHAVLGILRVTTRSQNHRGVQIEDGKAKNRNYTSPILQRVLAENIVIRMQLQAGEYICVPPTQDGSGSATAH